jgi:cytochrome d ubiquinol oxidase subunit I
VEPQLLLLSRIQFALTIMFHYLFPPLSIGLGVLLVLMEGTFLRTGDLRYHAMTRFWSRIFAVNFAMGVATGIVMEFQFGTNWAAYSRYVGDVFGSALAAEGIFAFFLESGFLAVLVFGWDRVSKGVHFLATLMVALGSIFSAVWIVVANSWQHTPAGFEVQDGRAVILDFWGMVFNPSSMHRLVHVLLGAFILGAFFVMSISAWYVLRRRHLEFARRSFILAMLFGTVSTVAIGLSGHVQARTVAHTQPAKLAAFEGHFETKAAPLYLVGWPDRERKTVYGLAIPGMLSFLVSDDFNKPVVGLDHFPPEDQPPVFIPFMSYHLMVGVAGVLLGLLALALFFWWRGSLFERRWLMALFVAAVLGPYLANQAGWVATETGRQPFVVYPEVEWRSDTDPVMKTTGDRPGLRTEHGLSSSRVVESGQVLFSIGMFSFIYLLLFAVWVFVLNSKIQHGPEEAEEHVPEATSASGLLTAASRLNPAGGFSLTEAGEETTPRKEKE